MKPLPPALQRAFPVPAGRHPARPWWSTWARQPNWVEAATEKRCWSEGGAGRLDGATVLRTGGYFRPLTPTQQDTPSTPGIKVKFTLGGPEAMPLGLPMPDSVELDAWLDHVDRHFPLPHPGFRPGQVWAMADGVGYRAVQVVETYLADATDPDHPEGLWGTLTNSQSGRMSPNLGFRSSVHFREDRLRAELQGWFLLADVVCPQLAPWAPSEAP